MDEEEEEEEDEDEDGELWGMNTFGTGNGEAGFLNNGGVPPPVPAPCPPGTIAKFNPEEDFYFCMGGNGEDEDEDDRRRL